MAGRITLWGASELLTNFFQHGLTLPENFWLALTLGAAPNAYVSGAELDEPLAGNYVRLQIPATTLYWDNNGAPQTITMNKDLSFATATADWGTVRFWALCSSNVGGYVYAFGDLIPMPVTEGMTVQVAADDLSVSLGPFYADQEP